MAAAEREKSHGSSFRVPLTPPAPAASGVHIDPSPRLSRSNLGSSSPQRVGGALGVGAKPRARPSFSLVLAGSAAASAASDPMSASEWKKKK